MFSTTRTPLEDRLSERVGLGNNRNVQQPVEILVQFMYVLNIDIIFQKWRSENFLFGCSNFEYLSVISNLS